VKGLICCYSGTGNTRLACEAIARGVESVTFELFDVVRDGVPDLTGVDLVGFAAFADFLGPPMRTKTFLQSLPAQRGKPAFVFDTYGGFNGKTLELLYRWTTAQGFRVVESHALHTPENYPPMIRRGRTFADAPNPKELAAFEGFIAKLDAIGHALAAGEEVPRRRPPSGLFRFLPATPRSQSRRTMGGKHVDPELCTECGVCREACPYGAIELTPRPVFNRAKCWGCWACYNRCPTRAIYTRRLRGAGHYPEPNAALMAKLGADDPLARG